MKNILLFVQLFLIAQLYPTGSIKVFKKYSNHRIFVETGSYKGRGIEFALKAGFKQVRSLEAIQAYYNNCCEKFEETPAVRLWLGDSSILLSEMIEDINEPITFWLDAHYHLPLDGVCVNPIMKELDQIANHPIKTHTIMIDDIRLTGEKHRVKTKEFENITLRQIMARLKQINPQYRYKFENGHIRSDILVAFIPKKH